MTQFEFIAIVISVVLGLSIARLVSGIGDSIRALKAGHFYWIHGFWIINILILVAGFWWGMFGWSLKEDWNFLNFLLILLFTINLYLLTDFLIPKADDSKINVKAYFFEHRKMFFGILIFTLVIDVLETSLLASTGKRDLPSEYPYVILALAVLSLVGYLSPKVKVQAIVVVAWGMILVAYATYGILFLGS